MITFVQRLLRSDVLKIQMDIKVVHLCVDMDIDVTLVLFYLVDGNYNEWSFWSACSATCGDGSRIRRRACENPEPSTGGKNCEALGNDVESESCNEGACPGKKDLLGLI